MIDVGAVKYIPYLPIYKDYQTDITGMNNIGGYKVINNVCYIMLLGTALNNCTITFPTPSVELNGIYFMKNNVPTLFTSNIGLNAGDTVNIYVSYNV